MRKFVPYFVPVLLAGLTQAAAGQSHAAATKKAARQHDATVAAAVAELKALGAKTDAQTAATRARIDALSAPDDPAAQQRYCRYFSGSKPRVGGLRSDALRKPRRSRQQDADRERPGAELSSHPVRRAMRRAPLVAAASAMALFALDLAACSRSTPSVTNVSWDLARQADGKGYRLTGAAKLAGGLDGWYPGNLTLIDDRGCRVETYVGDPRSSAEKSRTTTQTYDQTISFSHPVARAIFSTRYNESKGLDHPESFVDKPMFEQTRLVDASLHPPATPDSRCKFRAGTVEADAREKAAAQGPYANMSRQRVVATAINSAGFLCAHVTDLYPNSAGEIIAHCVKYRSGRGLATYRIDADGGTVEEVS